MAANDDDRRYLETKRDRFNHMLRQPFGKENG